MTFHTYIVLQIAAIAVVLAQPIFGWHAIPAFFNHSGAAAIFLGLIDAAILFVPMLFYAQTR